jgi:hypothetical protein
MPFHARVPILTITEEGEVRRPTSVLPTANPCSQVQVDRQDRTMQPRIHTTIHVQTPLIENRQRPSRPS